MAKVAVARIFQAFSMCHRNRRIYILPVDIVFRKRGVFVVVDKENAFILWFDQVGIEDVRYVGGKNASLGEMYRNLAPRGVNIPNGYCVTARAYHYFLEKAGVKDEIKRILEGLKAGNVPELRKRGQKVREIILKSKLPVELENAIKEGYYHLQLQYGKGADLAVRSSATAEDLPDASFAGQQETYLNITGDELLLEACKKCFASLFTDRAINYRLDKGFDHFSIGLSIGVQKMVRSDLSSSGVMFSIDTESGFKDAVFLTASYGLGENIVQGAVNPDEYYIFKPTLRQNYRPIITKRLGEKKIKMIYSSTKTSDGKMTKNIPVPLADRKKYVLNDDEILTLAYWATIIEDHYSWKASKFRPMDMEWAKDGTTGKLFIVQARPETIHSVQDMSKLRKYLLKGTGKILSTGRSIGEKIGQGNVEIIKEAKQISKFKAGGVLVTEMTDPDWEPIMKIASAIVTERGGRTCHAAIVSRELGIPCIVGTNNCTKTLEGVKSVTVDCSQGEEGNVYEGMVPFEIEEIDLKSIPRPRTKIMMNVGMPNKAFEESFIPNDGIGLAREEFIINSHIKIHPRALIDFKKLKDKKVKKEIEELTHGYADKTMYFVDKLAEGMGTIAAAYYPNDVIMRFSDFKTNEYRNLIGGQDYEPSEENPMIGWRGASRYYSDNYKDAFALECQAVLKARNVFGLKNLKVMVPFCRTVEEGRKVLAEMEKNGLKRGENELQVYVICEIPSNVILADKFSEIFDGFSIGSNDLTQLTLGLDRDSQLVASIYDERNEAVKKLIAQVIKTAKEKGRKIGICGQAPSDYPEFAEFLVEHGIDSISLNPDTVIKTTMRIYEKEKQLGWH